MVFSGVSVTTAVYRDERLNNGSSSRHSIGCEADEKKKMYLGTVLLLPETMLWESKALV